jgi:leucyl-tRNA synthetase
MDPYDHKSIESKWTKKWEAEKTHEPDLYKAEKPFYNLMMFPYPSAEGLHVGNLFAFAGSDIYGRFMRACGHTVFEPMGFDAFGIHSENFAMKIGAHPAKLIPSNIENFRENQLKRTGSMFNWEHQVDTTDPNYYKWTQWVFIQLFKAGLAYQKQAPVNWCPDCKTVLSDEQAEGGYCERHPETLVEKRNMTQWFFKITDFAQRLLDNLDWIDWSEITKAAQRRWIGRSEGGEIVFSLEKHEEKLVVFTTRPDTLWGATYMVLAPEHPLVEKLTTAEQKDAVETYVRDSVTKSSVEREDATREKTGVFTGSYAINPVNDTKIPIWVADYVLTSYGTGAIMAVPAHDTRDFEFATVFNLPIIEVISPDGSAHELPEAYTGEGELINSGPFDGTPSKEAITKVTDWLAEKGLAEHKINYRIHDWCISRQRYWGPPIPIIHCEKCGAVPVPDEDLPVVLPEIENFQPDGSGKSPLERVDEFVNTTCPTCSGPAKRETDVNDNFLDSAFYFFRYPSTHLPDKFMDDELTKKWLPVDMYIGGNEHAVLHLMYTRFITMAFHDIGLIDFEEPFKKFRAHGLLIKDGAKMSKSKGNVVNPDDYFDDLGADTFRTYLMFLGPYQEGGDFRDTGIVGVRRFIDRMWRFVEGRDLVEGEVTDPELLNLMHKTIKKVTEDTQALRYNTAIAMLMEYLNGLYLLETRPKQCAEVLVKLSAPFAPFVTHELWERLGYSGMVVDAPWPEYDEGLIRTETVGYAVQILSKIRGELSVPAEATKDEVLAAAKALPRIQELLEGKTIIKEIFVPGKLVNFVVKG